MIDKHEWQTAAFNALARWVSHRRREFTVEEARQAIGSRLEQPPECRWWGGVTKAALREGLMRRVPGWKPAASSHGAPKPVYVSARVRG